MEYKLHKHILTAVFLSLISILQAQVDSSLLVFETNFCHNPNETLNAFENNEYRIKFDNSKLKSLMFVDSTIQLENEQLIIKNEGSEPIFIKKRKLYFEISYKDTIWKIYDDRIDVSFRMFNEKHVIPDQDTIFKFVISDLNFICLREYKNKLVNLMTIYKVKNNSQIRELRFYCSRKGIKDLGGLKIINNYNGTEINIKIKESLQNSDFYITTNTGFCTIWFGFRGSFLSYIQVRRSLNIQLNKGENEMFLYFYDKKGRLRKSSNYHNTGHIYFCN